MPAYSFVPLELGPWAMFNRIIGTEIMVDDGSDLTLLTETREGYSSLCCLLTDKKHGRLIGPIVIG